MSSTINIIKASENNLKQVSLEIPKNKLVVVTGVSGSGKSSLVYDVIYREAENRYLGSFSSYARQFLGKMKRPAVEKIDGLSPAIAVNQKSVVSNPRSTVGTMTCIYDYLRLIFARLGKSEKAIAGIDRNLFSFNSPKGACPNCNGLGVEDRLDPELLIADPEKTLREGALVITTPTGYIIYSQVTMDVLDQVCRAEGFNTDIPWKDLTPEQKHVVLYGSDKIEIPYGKHTLESRMKWSGITAKPRDTGYYKGILPVMENILKRDRNKNILRFVRTVECAACNGRRLNPEALSVKWQGNDIARLADLSLSELGSFLRDVHLSGQEQEVAAPLIEQILKRIALLEKLGAGYLSCSRESTTLSGGEAQRLRLVTQVTSGLKGVLYIFDEPSIGLHPTENLKMIDVLRHLRDAGNTVLVVEHEDDFIRHADHLIDIGPAAGDDGGEVLINAPTGKLPALAESVSSSTLDYLFGKESFSFNQHPRQPAGWITITGASQFNLKEIDVRFQLSAINVVTGVSGAGKSTLTARILVRFLQQKLHGSSEQPGAYRKIEGWEKVRKVVAIDQSPIGRTPRSNPATYTKLADHIRDLFAGLPESKARGWKKGRFSFNVAGGRCETCQGAGYRQVGMHFLGDVEIVCENCHGRRFNDETLQVKYLNRNVFEVLELSVAEAVEFFADQPKIHRIVSTLHQLGLGYMRLGQRSTTLSGGEAQRVKLASELSRPASAHTLYVLDEPTTGLHNADVKVLLESVQQLATQKHTVIITEHHPGLIAAADHVVDLGPGSGKSGGQVMAMGSPAEIIRRENSLTGQALKDWMAGKGLVENPVRDGAGSKSGYLGFRGVTTHNLKGIDVDIPENKISVVTGVSGSGKSSLAFDTLYAEGRNRFLESFSPYVRSQIGMQARAGFDEVHGLTPTLAISRQGIRTGPRSTVGTMTGIYDLYRLLYSRIGTGPSSNGNPWSSLFSFNHQDGACPKCDGLGNVTVCDPYKLVSDPEKPLIAGAMDAHKSGKFYGDPYGQYVHTLLAAGGKAGLDFTKPWNELNERERQVAMYGTGDEIYDVTWKFKRGKREGSHHFKGKWQGFARLVEEEYARKHADRRGDSMLVLMKQEGCPACKGARLNPQALSYTIAGKNIAELSAMSITGTTAFFADFENKIHDAEKLKISSQLRRDLLQKLDFLHRLGLGYLQCDRISSELSGGEAQRVRLAAQLGNGLTGLTYILDEPTVGLHPADTGKLMEIVRELRDAGNTVVIVEHDREVILGADHLIELGPGAGEQGGRLIASGKPADLAGNPESVTGKYLKQGHLLAANKRESALIREEAQLIKIFSASARNLQNIDVEIPLVKMVAVTGVSGSGKSTLVFDVLAASWHAGKTVGCSAIEGWEGISDLITVTQERISASTVSNAATFTGIFDRIRDLFAKTPGAEARGLKKNHFSFNTRGGRCEKCEGQGRIKISLDFVSDVWVTCDECHGRRYQAEVLDCKLEGKDIYEVLEMSIRQAAGFFAMDRLLKDRLEILTEVGLGYLRIGQSTGTMSGGELQRLKLARELMKSGSGRNLYLFDEPSTGLHFRDVELLLKLFRKLVDQGHSLVIIEHDPDIIRNCDRVIDLGPGGGVSGGVIVAEGTPEDIACSSQSLTGRFL